MENSSVKLIKGQQRAVTQGIQKGIRVAAYCRVSTDGEEQLNSFSSQVKYYKEKIQSNPEWIYVGIYSDEAITGTKVTIREGFQKMIADCMEGKIDMVITKSISRFARNTVDTLNYVRKLKEKHIAVFFEEENINTLTMDGELMLTILSSVAQQEVQNISEHVKKGLKMKLQKGSPVGFYPCLGYDYDPKTRKITVNLEEAKIVQYIFERYAFGAGAEVIAKELREMNYLTKRGSSIWSARSIRDIIRNEKYIGDLLYGKTHTVDPICKKRVKNNGEYDQYYIENHHEAIISKELFEKANSILTRRSTEKKLKISGKFDDFTGKYPLSRKIRCGYCGATFTRRTHGQTTTTNKGAWKCVTSIRHGVRYCQDSKSIDDEAIQKAFIESLAILSEKNTALLDSFMNTLKDNIMSSNPKAKLELLRNELTQLNIRKNRAIDLMLDGGLSREEYDKRLLDYSEKIKSKEQEIILLEKLESKQAGIHDKLLQFRNVIANNFQINTFDRDVCDVILDKIIVGGYDENGNKIPYQVTIVFDIECSREINTDKDYFVIGEFNCKYQFYSFDIEDIRFRKKVKVEGFPVKIAVKVK